MEKLCRCREVDDLDVVGGCLSEEALKSCTGVFGTLSFEAVWQEDTKAGETTPFGLRAGDELVKDDLCHVAEVTELGFPYNERFGAIQAVSKFKAEHSGFAEWAIVDVEWGLVIGNMLQWDIEFAILDIAESGVSVAERPALAVLSGDADRGVFGQQRGISE